MLTDKNTIQFNLNSGIYSIKVSDIGYFINKKNSDIIKIFDTEEKRKLLLKNFGNKIKLVDDDYMNERSRFYKTLRIESHNPETLLSFLSFCFYDIKANKEIVYRVVDSSSVTQKKEEVSKSNVKQSDLFRNDNDLFTQEEPVQKIDSVSFVPVWDRKVQNIEQSSSNEPCTEKDLSEYELVSNENGKILTNSLVVAQVFDKEHKDVLRDIRYLINRKPNLGERNFAQTYYFDSQAKKQPLFTMDRKGFSMLALAFTGDKALDFREAFIDAFDKMEAQLNKPMTQTELVLWSAQRLVEIEREQMVQKKQLVETKMEVASLGAKTSVLQEFVLEHRDRLDTITNESNYMTILGFAKIRNINITKAEASTLGKAASKMCEQQNKEKKFSGDERYGKIGLYPIDILETIFKAHSLI